MKNLIIGSIAGVVIGAGTMFGLAHIPSVNAVIGKDTNTNIEDSEKVQQLETENSQLKLNISAVTDNLTKAQNQLVEKDNLITAKQEEIKQLQADKQSLQIQLEQALSNNGNNGSDNTSTDNSELVTNLQNQLEEKTNALSIAYAEIEQLRIDKESLNTRIIELESTLTQLEEELAQYKTLGDIDIYNVQSFNGTWYKDGKFVDYFKIDNGVVIHNANEDTGAVQNLSNQMYFFMNTNGGLKVNLSSDGNSFTTEDGSIYKKFYINTTETVVANIGDIVGVYSYDNKKLTLNGDNTLSLIDGDDTYYGAFTVSAISKNVGGNIHTTNYISANINLSDTQIQVEYEIVTGSLELQDKTNNNVYSLIESNAEPVLLGTRVSGYSVIIETDGFITIKPGQSVDLILNMSASRYSNSIEKTSLTVNGITKSWSNSSSDYVFKLVNNSDKIICSNTFELTMCGNSSASTVLTGILSFGGRNVSIKSYTKTANYPNLSFSTYFLSLIDSDSSTTSYITCDYINDYIDGSYTSDEVSFNIQDGIAEILDDTATNINCLTTAKTDGYDIYQTTTITYTTTTLVDGVETTVNNTIVVEYKNDLALTCKLNNELIAISRN